MNRLSMPPHPKDLQKSLIALLSEGLMVSLHTIINQLNSYHGSTRRRFQENSISL